jgi:hypothetical protein
MPSKVALPHGSKQRVTDGMDKHVGIRMPEQTLAVRDVNAAQNQFASGPKRVHVISIANPHMSPFVPD